MQQPGCTQAPRATCLRPGANSTVAGSSLPARNNTQHNTETWLHVYPSRTTICSESPPATYYVSSCYTDTTHTHHTHTTHTTKLLSKVSLPTYGEVAAEPQGVHPCELEEHCPCGRGEGEPDARVEAEADHGNDAAVLKAGLAMVHVVERSSYTLCWQRPL